jgi:hypothetical protein
MKQGDALFPFLFNFAFQYAIKKVQGNQVALEMNGIHQKLVFSHDINLLGSNMNTKIGKI